MQSLNMNPNFSSKTCTKNTYVKLLYIYTIKIGQLAFDSFYFWPIYRSQNVIVQSSWLHGYVKCMLFLLRELKFHPFFIVIYLLMVCHY